LSRVSGSAGPDRIVALRGVAEATRGVRTDAWIAILIGVGDGGGNVGNGEGAARVVEELEGLWNSEKLIRGQHLSGTARRDILNGTIGVCRGSCTHIEIVEGEHKPGQDSRRIVVFIEQLEIEACLGATDEVQHAELIVDSVPANIVRFVPRGV